MRILDQKKVAYIPHGYEIAEGAPCDAVTVAGLIGKDVSTVYKTLVLKAGKGNFYVFVVPGAERLDYKKVAKAVGEKSVAMVLSADLLGLTGYIHGGCSPIGMKKQFPTVFHESVLNLSTVTVSAGKIGRQVEIAPSDLISLINAKTADIIVSE
ncbi:MAG: Cys-tRNA(Pro) deacylase [Oscillospiraceae bacterium]|nr:Cys-tRNA(Pro) deacylase [Oscillospiraceae bacterium]